MVGIVKKNCILTTDLQYIFLCQSIENTSTEQSCVSGAPALGGPGAEGRDTLPNIISRAFNLFQMDIGGDNFTSNRRLRQRYVPDGSRPVIFDTIYKSGFLPAFLPSFWSWISFFNTFIFSQKSL